MVKRLSSVALIALGGMALTLGLPAAASAVTLDVATFDTYSAATTTATVEGAINPNNESTTYNSSIGVGITGGPGTVTSSPAGINCTSNGLSVTPGSTCQAAFPVGTQVTLTASPDTGLGAEFVGWSGAGCAGTGTCTITVPAGSNPTVMASFTEPPPADCALKPSPKVALKGPKAGQVVLNLKCDQTAAFTLGAFVTVRWRNAGKKRSHTWPLAGRSGNAQVETPAAVVMMLPKAALRRLREEHLSAFVSFELDATNANGATAATARLKLK
jgi:hypothetical protein